LSSHEKDPESPNLGEQYYSKVFFFFFFFLSLKAGSISFFRIKIKVAAPD